MKRILLLTALVALIAITLFCIVRPTTPTSDCDLLKLYEAKQTKTLSIKKAPLMEGALLLIHGNSAQACVALSRARELVEESDQLMIDHLLALTAYLDHQRSDFFTYFARSLPSASSPLYETHCRLLTALSSYLKGNWRDAAPLFEESLHSNSITFLDCVSLRAFPLSLRKLHLAHALIEMNEFTRARYYLQMVCDELGDIPNEYRSEGVQSLTQLLWGLSFLKESSQTHEVVCYENADSFFGKIENPTRFPQAKKAIANQCAYAIESNATPLLWKEKLIRHLVRWEEIETLTLLTDRLANNETVNLPSGEYSDPSQQEIRNFYKLLFEKRRSAAIAALESGTHSHSYHRLIHYLERFPELWDAEFQSAFERCIIRLCFSDLSAIDHLLQLTEGKLGQFHLLKEIVEQGKILWKSEGKEKRGTRLFEIACTYAHENEKRVLIKEIQSFWQDLFKEAEQAYLVRRLAMIHEMAERLDISIVFAMTKEKAANTIADAKYLLQSHNFVSAKNHAQWVLRCDPNNEEALYVFGLATFHLGDHIKAAQILKRLKEQDEEARQAIFLCQVELKRTPIVQGAEIEDES